MRIILNILLVIVGIPLFGLSLVTFGSLLPATRNELTIGEHIYFFGLWLISLGIFSLVYVKRAHWLQKIGIYKSWANFTAYITEVHGSPSVSDDEKRRFLSWAHLPELNTEATADGRWAKDIYKRIEKEITSQDEKKSYINCLAWFLCADNEELAATGTE